MNYTEYLSIRSDWHLGEIAELFERPLVDLLHISHHVHRHFHNPYEIQPCRIQSIKTGSCPEDCKYCPQSGHHNVNIEKTRLFSVEKTWKLLK